MNELAADRPGSRRANQLSVLGQHTGGVARWRGVETVTTRSEFGRVDNDVEGGVGDVEPDLVAVGDEGDRAGVDGFWRDMPDAQAGGAAGEPAVGEQQHVLTEPSTLDRAGDGQHLAHPGPALRAFVSDD